MELMQLKYFKTAAEAGSIAKAAQALFISAPALSSSISRLEKELGVKLFNRTNNKIILNQQGQILLRYANQVFTNLDCAKKELKQSVLQNSQHVSIACVSTTQWVDMITSFSQEFPQFTLSCTSVKRTELINSGLPTQYDFLFASDEDIPTIYANELDSIPLFNDHPVIMVHPDHPLAKQKSVSLAEVVKEPVFLPMQDYALYEHLVDLFALSGVPFPAGNAYSHLAMQQMVAQGVGIAFSSAHTTRTPSLPINYVPIRDCHQSWTSRLCWRKDHIFTEDDITFKTFVEKYYQSPSA